MFFLNNYKPGKLFNFIDNSELFDFPIPLFVRSSKKYFNPINSDLTEYTNVNMDMSTNLYGNVNSKNNDDNDVVNIALNYVNNIKYIISKHYDASTYDTVSNICNIFLEYLTCYYNILTKNTAVLSDEYVKYCKNNKIEYNIDTCTSYYKNKMNKFENSDIHTNLTNDMFQITIIEKYIDDNGMKKLSSYIINYEIIYENNIKHIKFSSNIENSFYETSLKEKEKEKENININKNKNIKKFGDDNNSIYKKLFEYRINCFTIIGMLNCMSNADNSIYDNIVSNMIAYIIAKRKNDNISFITNSMASSTEINQKNQKNKEMYVGLNYVDDETKNKNNKIIEKISNIFIICAPFATNNDNDIDNYLLYLYNKNKQIYILFGYDHIIKNTKESSKYINKYIINTYNYNLFNKNNIINEDDDNIYEKIQHSVGHYIINNKNNTKILIPVYFSIRYLTENIQLISSCMAPIIDSENSFINN